MAKHHKVPAFLSKSDLIRHIINLTVTSAAGFNKLHCSPLNYLEASVQVDNKDALLPEISPTATPQPFLPFLAPSPLTPFTNNTVPKLSGLYFCSSLNRFPKRRKISTFTLIHALRWEQQTMFCQLNIA